MGTQSHVTQYLTCSAYSFSCICLACNLGFVLLWVSLSQSIPWHLMLVVDSGVTGRIIKGCLGLYWEYIGGYLHSTQLTSRFLHNLVDVQEKAVFKHVVKQETQRCEVTPLKPKMPTRCRPPYSMVGDEK